MKTWLSNLGLAILAVFAPIQATLLTVLALIFSDLVLGIACAIKKKEPITSKGIRSTVNKILAYEISIMMAFLAENQLLDNAIPVMKIVSGLVIVAEMKSVLENSNILAGGNLFKSIINKLKS